MRKLSIFCNEFIQISKKNHNVRKVKAGREKGRGGEKSALSLDHLEDEIEINRSVCFHTCNGCDKYLSKLRKTMNCVFGASVQRIKTDVRRILLGVAR
jgi:hypothetical protein